MESYNSFSYVAKVSGRNQKAFNYAGTKDKRGLTFQFATAFRATIEHLTRSSLKVKTNDLIFGSFEIVKRGLKLGDLYGNRFSISLRNINSDLSANDIT